MVIKHACLAYACVRRCVPPSAGTNAACRGTRARAAPATSESTNATASGESPGGSPPVGLEGFVVFQPGLCLLKKSATPSRPEVYPYPKVRLEGGGPSSTRNM